MLLQELVSNHRVCFHEHFSSWESAITAACQPLVDDGSITEDYTQAIIRCVNQYGPYIVFAPNIAMPHSQEGGTGVNSTALAFMRVKEPVHFEEYNPEKDARLFFTVASKNHDEHLENMQALAELLAQDGVVDDLIAATCPNDLLRIDEKYAALAAT